MPRLRVVTVDGLPVPTLLQLAIGQLGVREAQLVAVREVAQAIVDERVACGGCIACEATAPIAEALLAIVGATP